MKSMARQINRELWNEYKCSFNSYKKKVIFRCAFTFWFACVVMRYNKFQIKFPGKYYYNYSFVNLVKMYIFYLKERIAVFLLKEFNIATSIRRKEYRKCLEYDIPYVVEKPILLRAKLSSTPDEYFLYDFLESHNLKIVEEHFDKEAIIYDVVILDLD